MTQAAGTDADWRKRFDATRRKIRRLRRNVVLEDTPEFRTSVRETRSAIRIQRGPYSLTFDRRTAMVTRAVVAGVRLDQVSSDPGLQLLPYGVNGHILGQCPDWGDTHR